MSQQIKKIFTKGRVILLVILLVFALISIHPNPWNDGVAVRSVKKDSAANLAGFESPLPRDKPMSREIITHINGKKVNSISDYEAIINTLETDDIVSIQTLSNYERIGENERRFSFLKHKKDYTLTINPLINIIQLEGTEEITINETIEVNETLDNGSIITNEEIVEVTKTVQKTKEEIIGVEDIGLTVYDAPTTNLKKGLDLEGGTRVLLQPAEEISEEDMDIVISNLKQRLNVYGLSDIIVREAGDFISGNKYIIVEVAGANEDDVN